TVLSLFVLGRRVIGTRPAFLAALVLVLTALFTQIGRIVLLDSLLTLFVTLALLLAHEAVRGRRLRWSWWIPSAICCGLGVLTKGPIALVLTAPPLATYVWLNRDKARLSLIVWGIYAA